MTPQPPTSPLFPYTTLFRFYPFGHGLSYTTFSYSAPTVAPARIPPDGRATVSVEVTNTGARAGDEVVQLYIRAEVRSEEHTSELQSHVNLVCRLLLEKKKENS